MQQKLFKVLAGFVIGLLVLSLAPVGSVQAASTLFVLVDGDDTSCNGTVNVPLASGAPNCAFATIGKALGVAASGDTIQVGPGPFTLASQVINKSVTLVGNGLINTSIAPTADATVWLTVNSGMAFNLSGFSIIGTGKQIQTAIQSSGSGTIANNLFQDIAATGNQGTGVELHSNMTVTGNTFQTIGRAGVVATGAGVSNAIISNNVYTGKGAGAVVDYGIEVADGAHATITGNVITANQGTGGSAGIYVNTANAAGTVATLTSNALTFNTDGIKVGATAGDTSTVTAHFNTFNNNTQSINTAGPTVDAINNWWGCNEGPANVNCKPVSANVSFTPWLVLSAGPGVSGVLPNPIPVTTNLNFGSDGLDKSGAGHVLDGTSGTILPPLSGSASPTTVKSVNGVFTTNFTPPAVPAGTKINVCTAVDNSSICNVVTITQGTLVAEPDTYVVVKNITSMLPVLSNDLSPNGATLTAVVNVTAAHGTLTAVAGGFNYTPTAGYTGPDTFTYHATAGAQTSNTVTVTITVLDKILLYLPVIRR